MPISSTIRFFVIVLRPICYRAQKYQGGSDRTTIFAQHAAFELGASGLEIGVADITASQNLPRHDDAALVRDDWSASIVTADPPSSPACYNAGHERLSPAHR
jgi:hypothetical protein